MATGNSLALFLPPGEGPASNYATFGARNGHHCLEFDAATDESAIWSFVIPAHYSGGGITVRVYWAGASATTGSIVLMGAWERIDDEGLDVDADSFAADVSGTFAAPGTTGMVQYSEIAFTNSEIDGLLVNELARFRLTRDANNVSDDMSGDAQILAVAVRET